MKAQHNIDADTVASTEELPRIDEHTITIRVDDPERVWSALGDVLGRSRVPGLGRSRIPTTGYGARLLRVHPGTRSGDPRLAGSTLPGFTIVRAEPGKELALAGRHRFSLYALIFHLAAGKRHVTLSAETRADFPGVSGRVYRGLVTAHAATCWWFARSCALLADARNASEMTLAVHQSPLDGTGAISRGNSRSNSIIRVGWGIPCSPV